MKIIVETYCIILKDYISKCFSNQKYVNPVELNKERFKVKSLFMASILFLKYSSSNTTKNILSETRDWFRKTFSETNLFSLIISEADPYLINCINNNLAENIGIEVASIDISVLYETLLCLEVSKENSVVDITNAKNYRNRLGSYYTPIDLAKIITTRTIDTYFKLNNGINKLSTLETKDVNRKLANTILKDILSINVVDLSSGTGHFLMETVEYFENVLKTFVVDNKILSKYLYSIVRNIHAFDVDWLALEIAKLQLILKIKRPLIYNTIKHNYVHCNSLLHTETIVDDVAKRNIFSEGFIYNDNLSLNKSKLRKYDIVLGNPPWEKIRFEKEHVSSGYSSLFMENKSKVQLTKRIKRSKYENKNVTKYHERIKNEIEKAKTDIRHNSFFELSSKGELNTYALFTEAAVNLKSKRGVIGLVLKSSVITSQVNSKLFKYLKSKRLIIEIYDFINRNKYFNIDSRERFCFLLLGDSNKSYFHIYMNLIDINKIGIKGTKSRMLYNDLDIINPITGMLPNFSNEKELRFLLKVSRKYPTFKEMYSEVKYGRLVHFTNHAKYIRKKKTDNNIPIYEGKYFNQLDGKYSGFNGVNNNLRYGSKVSSVILKESQKALKNCFPEARFYIDKDFWKKISNKYSTEFILAWRSLTSATNTRTCIATILPFIPTSQSVQFLATKKSDLLYFAGLFNSIVFDFIVKKKLSNIDLTQSVINQVPVPRREDISLKIEYFNKKSTIKNHVSRLVCYLLENDIRLERICRRSKNANNQKMNRNRNAIMKRIDLLFMYLYNISGRELDQIYLSFTKQYSSADLGWFKEELRNLKLNNSISSAITTSSSSPF